MLFTEAEKRIFEYPSPDGSGPLYDDPLRLRNALIIASEGRIDQWLKDSKTKEQIESIANPEARRAEILAQTERHVEIVAATRKALGDFPDIHIKTGQGVLDAWVLETLQLFLDFIDQKKTKPNSSPTSSPSGE